MTGSSGTLSRELIQLIRSKRVTATDLEQAALFTLDAVANAIGGRNSEAGAILLQWATLRPAHVASQAFVLGALTHILETDDLHRASVTHPGCVVVPVALALGARQQTTGRDLLTAILQGFEAMCRVGNAVGQEHYRIWHNTATCGPYGAAMAAASLLDLDDGQAQHALGNAGTQSSGLWQFLETGAMSKHLHAGRAAESGLLAAELAKLGFTGPPAILEGGKGFFAGACPGAEAARVTADPDADWQLLATSIKPWPSCRHTHPAIDAALELHERLQGRGIESVDARVYQATLDVCDRPFPNSEYEAKFSISHCIAAALADGQVNFASFDGDSRQRLAPLRECITAVVAEPFRSAYPDEYWGAGLSVTATDGEVLDTERRACKGDPESPLDRRQMIDKAMLLMRHGGLDESPAERLVAAILDLAAGDSDWQTLATAIPDVARESTSP
jgi:2-methylcitrate dehydratase PrpD